MTQTAVVATALNTAATRSKVLTLAGVDLLVARGLGALYGVSIETVRLTEAGPGGTSWLTFTIDDPDRVIVLRPGMDVRFHDCRIDMPLFSGYVATWEYRANLGLGRTILVRAIGADALLDWMIVPSASFPAGMRETDAVQSAVALATGIGAELRALADTSPSSSSRTWPIANLGLTRVLGYALTLTNVTLRAALQAIGQASGPNPGSVGVTFAGDAFVDSYRGLRYPTGSNYYPLFDQPPFYNWNDLVGMSPADVVAPGASPLATDPSLAYDVTQVPRGVFVQGGAPAGTGLVTDGSGIPGPIVVLNEPNSVDAVGLRYAARSYFVTQGRGVWGRGTFHLSAYTNPSVPGTEVRAGGAAGIADTQLGSPGTMNLGAISAIDKSYNASGTEEWDVHYGDFPPSLARTTRRLTRSTLS